MAPINRMRGSAENTDIQGNAVALGECAGGGGGDMEISQPELSFGVDATVAGLCD